MSEKDLLVDCLRRLNRSGITYMLTGSMASNYWGIPRTTHDLDFVIELQQETIPRLVQAFATDFYLDEQAVRAAFHPPHQFNAIDLRSPLKIDFWLLQDKPFEQAMFSRRFLLSLFGEKAWISTAEDTILHKLYWNSLNPSDRQMGDAAGIIAVQRDALDLPYLSEWAGALQVQQAMDDLLTGRIRPKQT